MKLNRRAFAAGLLMASAAVPAGLALAAEAPKDTLVIVSEKGPNGLDTMVPTANDHSRMVGLAGLRPARHAWREEAGGRHRLLRRQGADAGTRGKLGGQRRREDLCLPSAQGRHVPRRRAGDG